MNSIKEIISKELSEDVGLLDLIPDGTSIEFRLGNAGAIDHLSTRRVSTPAYFVTPGRCIIRDPFDKNKPIKEIINISGHEPIQIVGQGTVMQPTVASVKFVGGSIFCGPGDENMYNFLKLNSKNGSNPHRDKKKAIKFYEVDEKKEAALQVNKYDYKVLAANILRDIEDDDDLIPVAKKIMKVHSKTYAYDLNDSAKLRLALQGTADSNALDFLIAVEEPKSYARVLVDYAISRNQMFFDDHKDNLTWKFKKTPGEKGKTTICKVDEKRKMKELIEFLTSDKGNEHFVELKRLNNSYYAKV